MLLYLGQLLTVHTVHGNSEKAHGPAWSNSLFEDNAEFGYGMLLAQEYDPRQD